MAKAILSIPSTKNAKVIILADIPLCTEGKPPDHRKYDHLKHFFCMTSTMILMAWMRPAIMIGIRNRDMGHSQI